MYTILYHPRTQKFLSKIPRKDASKLIDKLSVLSRNPFTHSLDIKKLATTTASYRLRVGTIRVIYEVNTVRKHLYVHDIDFRGNIY